MNKIEKLCELMKKDGIDYCLISDPSVIAYYTGDRFMPGERFLCLSVSEDGKLRYYLNLLFQYKKNEIETYWYSDAYSPIDELSKNISGNVALDKNMVSKFVLELMSKNKECHYLEGTVIDEVKAIKDIDEIKKMIASSKLNDRVMEEVAKLIEVGKSEKKLAEEIMAKFKEYGSEAESFSPIVAYHDHAADPHAEPSERVLKEGEAVVVDMGCVLDDYCSDMTRTFFVNKNTEKEIYDIVLKANMTAEKMIKPGIRFRDIDMAARKVIEDAGYGEYFIHRLGHGIGRSVHEPFDVSSTDEVIVKEGMCFSIEPGIYIPGRIGIRIEDLVYVTKDGVEILNHYPKDQEVLKR
ncbi:MAG: aminopeptidase P family protein [Erysipelotrichaceae bacterium]|nr:aminopeptidase P family protein [Erysipelotrichaceae bacterium]